MIPAAQLAALTEFGWESALAGSGASSVWAGDQLPEVGAPDSIFLTSDKLNAANAAEPSIWPSIPASPPTVAGDQGCVWTAAEVRSQWRELHVWNFADRIKIRTVAPSFIDRWNNLTPDQQNALRNSHSHSASSFPDCPLSTTNPEDDLLLLPSPPRRCGDGPWW